MLPICKFTSSMYACTPFALTPSPCLYLQVKDFLLKPMRDLPGQRTLFDHRAHAPAAVAPSELYPTLAGQQQQHDQHQEQEQGREQKHEQQPVQQQQQHQKHLVGLAMRALLMLMLLLLS